MQGACENMLPAFFCSTFVIQVKMKSGDCFTSFISLLQELEAVFSGMRKKFPAEVTCGPGCVDCCYACFNVGFVEAMFINHHWRRITDEEVRKGVLLRAGQARATVEEKRKELDGALDLKDRSKEIATWRVRCPLLNDEKRCVLYEYRPVTCRVYGLPTEIYGKGHVCGFSGFDSGMTYPTVKLDAIAAHLDVFSQQLVAAIPDLDSDMAGQRFFLFDVVSQESSLPEIKSEK